MSDWLRAYYDDVDNMRLDDFAARHTEDVVVRFANNPPAHGIDQVRQNIGHFWTMIGGLKHHFVHVWNDGDTTILEADIDYTRTDGDVVTVPCTTVLHRRGELVDQVRIYLDLAPVFAPAAAGAGAGH
jgi:ketosteroid isomerase-like protein